VSDAVVQPIVEGHGEYEAVRSLIQRVWTELVGGDYVEVLRPIRQPKSQLVITQNLAKAVEFASSKLRDTVDDEAPRIVLLLLDADSDPPCVLGPQLLAVMKATCGQGVRAACVIASVEYETWFVAAAESLVDFLQLEQGEEVPLDPEEQRCGKQWISRRFKKAKYSETVDQPAMTAAMDLAMCRSRSPSFDKLCRELERVLLDDGGDGAGAGDGGAGQV
jgi:hypothetical protein